MMTNMWDDFPDRVKMIAPIWSFGKGMRLGDDLEEHKENVLFAVLLIIFERELNDDENRKGSDIEMIVREVLLTMNLDASEEKVRRITSGLLWNGNEKNQNPFAVSYFDPKSKSFNDMTYRYLEDDRIYSNWEEGGNTVYKITEVAQNIIFISREMQEELSIDIEQLYSLQLIKNGNFTRASRRIQDLKSRVKVLANRELETQHALIQNPKLLLSEEFMNRDKHEKEIRRQFEEEEKNFKEIQRQLQRVRDLPEHQESRQVIDSILEDVDDSRRMHDQLARYFIETFDIQLTLRVEHAERLWDVSSSSLKKDIYENIIVENGVQNLDTIANIIEPLFSPKAEFILPMDWLWEPHTIIIEANDEETEQEEVNKNEMIGNPKYINWNQMANAWSPIFEELLETGTYDICNLKDISLEQQDEWFEQDETFDIWMIFSTDAFEIPQVNMIKKYDDDRMCLMQALIRKNDVFKNLIGKRLDCELDRSEEFKWNHYNITSRTLKLRGVIHEL